MTDPKKEPQGDKPVPLSQHRNANLLCHFCHQVYQGPADKCPHCGRQVPKIQTG